MADGEDTCASYHSVAAGVRVIQQLGGPEFIKVFLINLTNAEKTWCMALRYILVQSCSSKWYGHMSFGSHLTNKDFNLFCCACLHHNVTVYTTIGAHVQAHAGFILTQS